MATDFFLIFFFINDPLCFCEHRGAYTLPFHVRSLRYALADDCLIGDCCFVAIVVGLLRSRTIRSTWSKWKINAMNIIQRSFELIADNWDKAHWSFSFLTFTLFKCVAQQRRSIKMKNFCFFFVVWSWVVSKRKIVAFVHHWDGDQDVLIEDERNDILTISFIIFIVFPLKMFYS